MQIRCKSNSDNLSNTLDSPHTPRIYSNTPSNPRKDFNIKPRTSRPKHSLTQVPYSTTFPSGNKLQSFVDQLEVTRKTRPNISDLQIPLNELISPTKKSSFYSPRSQPSSPCMSNSKTDIVGNTKSLGPKTSSKALGDILSSGQKQQGTKLVKIRGLSRDGSTILPRRASISMSQRMNSTQTSSFKLLTISPRKEINVLTQTLELKTTKTNSEEVNSVELDPLALTTKSNSSKPLYRKDADYGQNKKSDNLLDLSAKFRREIKKADSVKNLNTSRTICTSESTRVEIRKLVQISSEWDDLTTENTPRTNLETRRIVKFETRPGESPIDGISIKMRDFLLKSQDIQTPKSVRGGSCDARIQKELSMAERKNGNGSESGLEVWEDMENNRNKEYTRPKKNALDKVFVTGPNDFFQINPTNKTYKEFIDFFNEDLRNAEDFEKYDRRIFEEKRITKEDYKPMMIWFGEGSRIVQPKYMTSMGSMCYTELWPKKMNQRMQKQLVRVGDYVRMSNGGRTFETVYRPKKWHKQDDFKKKLDGNKQAIKNGHEAERRTALPFGNGRPSRMVLQDDKK